MKERLAVLRAAFHYPAEQVTESHSLFLPLHTPPFLGRYLRAPPVRLCCPGVEAGTGCPSPQHSQDQGAQEGSPAPGRGQHSRGAWERMYWHCQGQHTGSGTANKSSISKAAHTHSSAAVNQNQLGAKLSLGVNKLLLLQNALGAWNTDPAAGQVSQLGASHVSPRHPLH